MYADEWRGRGIGRAGVEFTFDFEYLGNNGDSLCCGVKEIGKFVLFYQMIYIASVHLSRLSRGNKDPMVLY
jgi:hypothetical protein